MLSPHLRRLDGNTSFLLVFACVGKSRLSSPLPGDDASLAHEGVGERGLAVIDVSNHRHVADVRPLVHNSTNLLTGGR